eukprot:Sspe_Gene.86133::Locus_56864_Transcript_1_1_Confidence_1.000_Length_3694::g.86133::m.86133
MGVEEWREYQKGATVSEKKLLALSPRSLLHVAWAARAGEKAKAGGALWKHLEVNAVQLVRERMHGTHVLTHLSAILSVFVKVQWRAPRLFSLASDLLQQTMRCPPEAAANLTRSLASVRMTAAFPAAERLVLRRTTPPIPLAKCICAFGVARYTPRSFTIPHDSLKAMPYRSLSHVVWGMGVLHVDMLPSLAARDMVSRRFARESLLPTSPVEAVASTMVSYARLRWSISFCSPEITQRLQTLPVNSAVPVLRALVDTKTTTTLHTTFAPAVVAALQGGALTPERACSALLVYALTSSFHLIGAAALAYLNSTPPLPAEHTAVLLRKAPFLAPHLTRHVLAVTDPKYLASLLSPSLPVSSEVMYVLQGRLRDWLDNTPNLSELAVVAHRLGWGGVRDEALWGAVRGAWREGMTPRELSMTMWGFAKATSSVAFAREAAVQAIASGEAAPLGIANMLWAMRRTSAVTEATLNDLHPHAPYMFKALAPGGRVGVLLWAACSFPHSPLLHTLVGSYARRGLEGCSNMEIAHLACSPGGLPMVLELLAIKGGGWLDSRLVRYLVHHLISTLPSLGEDVVREAVRDLASCGVLALQMEDKRAFFKLCDAVGFSPDLLLENAAPHLQSKPK